MNDFWETLKTFFDYFVNNTGLVIVRTLAFFCFRACYYKDNTGYYAECDAQKQ